MKVKEWIGRHKKAVIVLAMVLVLAVVLLARMGRGGTSVLVEESPIARSIYTYKSFSGNIEPATDTKVFSKVSQQVTDVLVAEGDTVKAGDVIATLDDTAVRQNIAKQEVSLSSSKTNNAYSISDAQRNYDNYKETLDKGLNTSINSAWNTLSAADDALDAAIEDRDTTLKSIDSGTYPDTQALYDARAAAQTAYDAAKAAYDASTDEEKSTLETTLHEAEAALTAANTAFNDAREAINDAKQAAVDSARKSYGAACDSYDATCLVAQQQLESYEAAVERAKATGSTAGTELELTQLRASLENYTICAPCDGTVTELNIEAGGMVSGGTSVATISDLNAMKVAVNVDEYAVLDTGEGSTVTIVVDSIGRTYTGTITRVADVAQLNNGVSYFAAEVVFTADEYVKSGMSAEVRLTTANAENVLTLSADALHYRTDGTTYVLVKSGKEQIERDVETGVTDGSFVEIVSGLTAEDTVLTQPSSDDMMPGGVVQRVRDRRDG